MRKKVTLAVVLVTLIGLLGAVGVASGRSRPARVSAAGDDVQTFVTRDLSRQAPSEFWTEAKMKAAKPMVAQREGVAPGAFGTANLDFTRARITPQSANKAKPYRAAGKLFFTTQGGSPFVCSASVIDRRLVVTAAHCIHSGSTFYTNWLFVPAYDGTKVGNAQRPYGTWNWSRAEVPINWINTGGALPNDSDFGIIVATDQSLGGPVIPVSKKTGEFGKLTGRLFDNHVTMLGYPCNLDACNIMQRNDSSDHRPGGSPNGQAFEYGSDMTGGSSGGPWVQNFGNPDGPAPQGSWTERNVVVAVTSYIYTDPAVKILGASQFNADFTTILNNSCAAAAGNC
jgi:V8-like Glu-specific endopeptidase